MDGGTTRDSLWSTTPAILLRGYGPYLFSFIAALAIHFLIFPRVGDYTVTVLNIIGINIILAVSLNVVNGYTGQFSLGHAAFMGIGAYTSGGITYYGSHLIWGTNQAVGSFLGTGDWFFVASIAVAGVVAALFGLLVGLPSLRLRGDYLAIVTVGFGEVMRVIMMNTREQIYTTDEVREASLFTLTTSLGSSRGFVGLPHYSNAFWIYLFVFITLIVCYRVKYSVAGRGFLAIRENELAAEAMGVPTTQFKVKAFVLAAFFAGIAGALYAHMLGQSVNPNAFGFQKSVDIFVFVVIGGMGSISGSVLGVVGLTSILEGLRGLNMEHYRLPIYAVLLVIVMLFRPQGVFGIHEFWEIRWIRRLIAKVKGLVGLKKEARG
jgi:branched-chain amino acid transport system permease protein